MLRQAVQIAALISVVTLTLGQLPATRSPDSPSRPIAVDPEPLKQRLSNGLNVVIQQQTDWDDVCVQLWFRGGSRLDPPELAGRSRLALENWLRAQRLRERVAAIEAHVELQTRRDAHGILMRVAPKQLAEAINILVRLFRETTSPPGAAFDTASPDSTPSDNATFPDEVWRAAVSALLGGHPDCVYPSLRTAAARQIPRAELLAFAAKWFIPSHAVLAISGDVQPLATYGNVKQAFAAVAWQSERRTELPALPERITLSEVEVDLAGGVLAWSTPGLGAFENVYLDVLMAYLKLRLAEDETGFDLIWRREAWSDGGVLVLYIVPLTAAEPAAVRRAAKRILSLITALASEPPEPLRFLRAAGIARRHYLAQVNELSAAVEIKARAYLNNGDWELVDRTQARLADPHVEPLQVAAKRLVEARWVRLVGKRREPAPIEPPVLKTLDGEIVSAEKRLLTPRLSLRLEVLPGRALAEVITLVRGSNHRDPTAEAMGHPFGKLPFSTALAEYLDIHAATLTPVVRKKPAAIGLRATVPGDRADSLIEWSARVLRTQNPNAIQSATEIELVVIGSVEPELIELAARESWSELTVDAAPPKTEQNSTTSAESDRSEPQQTR